MKHFGTVGIVLCCMGPIVGTAWGADAVVALLDGPMVEDGTACEIGIFYALMQTDSTKKGILGLLTDLRSTLGHEGHGLNLFVLGCIEAAGKVCSSMDEVAAALAEWG